jgi:hypothetical protein
MAAPRNRSAESLVPGISKYPDLMGQFDRERAGLKENCRQCDWNTLLDQFADRVRGRERAQQYARRRSGQA